MPLDHYLTKRRISQSDFGALLEPPVTQGAISQWVQGVTRVSLHRALEIQARTKGAVTVKDCASMFGRTKEPA